MDEYAMTGFGVREHRVEVPVDRADPHRFGTLEVFAREVVDPAKDADDLPLVLFLQGGPGGQSPRPMPGGGWWSTLLRTHRVVLLDQRGTGRSGRVDGVDVAAFDDAATAAAYLACFRADAVVEDAEALRRTVYGGRRWTTLGQSYGGFLTLTYLSRHPEALDACWVTGGLPPVGATAEDVYRATYPRQEARNRAFRRAFPDDGPALDALADRVAAGGVVLPTGEELTVERLQALGMPLGMSTGVDALHWLLETALDRRGEPAHHLLADVAARTGFDANPLYAVLQEVIYHSGPREPGWAAAAEHARHPEFAADARPLLLTGEAIFPWMYAQVPALRPFRGAAEELAARTDWPELYDVERLAANEVPVAAVQYVDDPYVDLELALRTADGLGSSQVWITNEFLHDGLRVAADTILPRLQDLTAGRWTVTSR
ncbi:alpha/beta fold hydrolase [Cellulomonas sp. 179-A 9B4 NHS]|uniref:alpha/beta fold hydrolase n=1 Tax=Cellulomonas sp. 179-A 9B4 NHS TaxID=3142379 RepID=UPI0039A0AA0C